MSQPIDVFTDLGIVLIAFSLLIISSFVVLSYIIPPSPQQIFCTENNMQFISGDKEAFNYCLDKNGTAYTIGEINGEVVFVKKGEIEELKKE